MIEVSKVFNWPSLLWMISSFIFGGFELFQRLEVIDYSALLFSYLFFVLLMISISLHLTKNGTQQFNNKKNPISSVSFILGSFVIVITNPLFENDHFRYLWEAKTIWHGYNPYTDSPLTISDISFSKKENIAFSDLTTIYPPFGMLFLSLFGGLSFKYALISLQVVNAFFSWIFLTKMWKIMPNLRALILLIPFLQKEFIQSVHLDLLSVIFIVYSFNIIKSRKEMFSKNNFNNISFILIAYLVKVTPIILAPFILLNPERKEIRIRDIAYLLLGILSLPIFYFLIVQGDESGVSAFSENWVWNPGLYSIVTLLLNFSKEFGRIFCFFSFVLSYSLIVIFYYKKREVGKESSYLTLIIALLFFCSPVANSWYFIFLAPFSWISKNTFGLLYILVSAIGYLPQLGLEYSLISEIGLHIFFFPTVYISLKQILS